MSQMQELYTKVSKDAALQLKFNEILKNAEQTGKEETGQKLLAFAEDAGFSVSLADMESFFQNMEAPKEGELSDDELDLVAGGKSTSGIYTIAVSVVSYGMICGAASLALAIDGRKECGEIFR